MCPDTLLNFIRSAFICKEVVKITSVLLSFVPDSLSEGKSISLYRQSLLITSSILVYMIMVITDHYLISDIDQGKLTQPEPSLLHDIIMIMV